MIQNLLVIIVLPSALPCVEGFGNCPALTGSEGACLFRRNAAGYVFRVNARARSVKPGTDSEGEGFLRFGTVGIFSAACAGRFWDQRTRRMFLGLWVLLRWLMPQP